MEISKRYIGLPERLRRQHESHKFQLSSSWRERVIRSSASCWNEVEVPRSSGARVNIVSGPALRSGIAQAGEIGKGREDD
ncbi:hypothetical protein F2Q68_00019188 [Brassica cretica]|uniref:Uncharacterized protein n=1 Tax=Brassica cretica TaxID=69181 RepID=A0A8S9G165_BRACR|nr:hypothetical protein F2Q68_00019188 [Brassica cretica]